MATIGDYLGIGSTAQRYYNSANASAADSLEKISSGSRINRAADDAAGLAVTEKMNAQLTGISQYSKNAQDGINYTRTADSALGNVNQIMTRMKELSVQAANGTYNDDQRAALQNEYSQLSQEIDRIGQATKFNGIQVFRNDEFSTAVGEGASGRIGFKLGELSSKALGLDQVDLSSAESAGEGTKLLENALDGVSKQRSKLGATENRLASTINYLAAAEENTAASIERKAGTDFAKEIMNWTQNNVQSQVAVSMMKQSQNLMQSDLLTMMLK